jgi:hypothetical protein
MGGSRFPHLFPLTLVALWTERVVYFSFVLLPGLVCTSVSHPNQPAGFSGGPF